MIQATNVYVHMDRTDIVVPRQSLGSRCSETVSAVFVMFVFSLRRLADAHFEEYHRYTFKRLFPICPSRFIITE